ncbi:MAG: cation:proton antiporter [Pseudomonadota bacterium]|nr:cation:proton antiporter [Pseudomonadota bacterium]
MPHHLLLDALILALAAFALVAVVVRLRFSPIVGYLAAGILVGPQGLNLLPDAEGIHLLGEFGVALLMFVVGLEFSWPRMVAARKVVFGLGSLQVAITALVATLVGLSLGAPLLPSLLVGFAIAMSSTAVVHKQMLDQDESTSHHGVLATGFLLFQDFAALPLLAIVAALGHEGDADALRTIARVTVMVGVFLVVALLARRTVGRLLAWTARSASNEVFLLSTVLLILATAFAAEQLALSLPVGAFIVGMMVGESDFRHQLEEEIRPFRDLLLGLFFLTIGTSIDLALVAREPMTTAAALILLVLVKFSIVFAVVRFSRADRVTALRTALILAHGGEFSLLIVSQSLAGGLIPAAFGQPVLAAAALSLMLAPALVQWNGRIAAAVAGREHSGDSDHAEPAEIVARTKSFTNHVILAGCGPVGRLVATALEASGVPYVAVERDVARLRKAQSQGHHVVFGDVTRPGILKAAGVHRASAVVALLNERRRLEQLVHRIRQLEPGLPVIVSTRDDTGLKGLVEAGATHIFPENLAAGLALAAQTMMVLGVPPREALARVRAVRSELNPELRALPPE